VSGDGDNGVSNEDERGSQDAAWSSPKHVNEDPTEEGDHSGNKRDGGGQKTDLSIRDVKFLALLFVCCFLVERTNTEEETIFHKNDGCSSLFELCERERIDVLTSLSVLLSAPSICAAKWLPIEIRQEQSSAKALYFHGLFSYRVTSSSPPGRPPSWLTASASVSPSLASSCGLAVSKGAFSSMALMPAVF